MTPLQNKGAVTLLAVLISGLIVVGSSGLLLLSAISRTKNTIASTSSVQTFYNASACAERALLQVYNNQSYSGTTVETLNSGTCSFTVINLGGENRRIQAVSNDNNSTRRLEVVVSQLNPSISVASWQEIPSF